MESTFCSGIHYVIVHIQFKDFSIKMFIYEEPTSSPEVDLLVLSELMFLVLDE